MTITDILSQLQPLRKLVNKVLGLTLDNRFLGYLLTVYDPLPCLFARSKMYTPCAPQNSDIKQ